MMETEVLRFYDVSYVEDTNILQVILQIQSLDLMYESSGGITNYHKKDSQCFQNIGLFTKLNETPLVPWKIVPPQFHKKKNISNVMNNSHNSKIHGNTLLRM
jgi:hypothetical protein